MKTGRPEGGLCSHRGGGPADGSQWSWAVEMERPG